MTSSSCRIIIRLNRILNRFDNIRLLSFFIDNDEHSTSNPSRRVRFHHFHFIDSPGFPSPSGPATFPLSAVISDWIGVKLIPIFSSFPPGFHSLSAVLSEFLSFCSACLKDRVVLASWWLVLNRFNFHEASLSFFPSFPSLSLFCQVVSCSSSYYVTRNDRYLSHFLLKFL